MRKTSREENKAVSSVPGGVEVQEAQAQQELVRSEELPARCRPSWAAAEALGIKRLGPVPDDKLFVRATLPQGWKKLATDHSYWSKIVDESGVERVSIFYKGAFYDRDAFMDVLVQPEKGKTGS